MSLRRALGVLILGYAIHLTRNLIKTLAQSQRGFKRRTIFGMNAELESGPLSPAKRAIYLVLMLPLNIAFYLFAFLLFFGMTLSDAVSYITRLVK